MGRARKRRCNERSVGNSQQEAIELSSEEDEEQLSQIRESRGLKLEPSEVIVLDAQPPQLQMGIEGVTRDEVKRERPAENIIDLSIDEPPQPRPPQPEPVMKNEPLEFGGDANTRLQFFLTGINFKYQLQPHQFEVHRGCS